ncbi:hypothetical protein [Leifsonia sp. NCR5]|uniref:hypothetical protein n=1 Tax=Leifsonia sp. NCR5 TaxID=1978342 RepID=UPI00117A2122|nr:hypothetical protein [Leifsonia sp. NCR5]
MKSKKPLHGIAAFAGCVTIAVGLLGAAPAFADTSEPATLESVARATPETTRDAAQIPTTASGTNAIDAHVADAEVVIPVEPEAGISVGTSTGTIGISLPFASSAETATVESKGIVSYDNNNGSTSVPVVTAAGALQINTVITDSAAPSRYSYQLTLPSGGQIVPAGRGYFVVNAEGDPVTFIAEPWAKDARGVAVPTHYELNDTTLTQVVDHRGTANYPIVADPAFVWEMGLPSVKLNRAETKTATTMTGMATVCGWVTRLTGYVGGALCGANAGSILVNSQRAYNAGKCEQLLIGPGVIGSLAYSGGYCK